MSKEYRAKVFKSGNSMALRLPKALGLEEGTEMVLREDRATFTFEPVDKPKRKFDIDKIWGCAAGSGLQFIKSEDRVFEERTLLWDVPEWSAKSGRDE
jgi:antitoxin VapB